MKKLLDFLMYLNRYLDVQKIILSELSQQSEMLQVVWHKTMPIEMCKLSDRIGMTY